MEQYNQDILNKITQQQIQNRLKHAQLLQEPSYFNQDQINYKRNYYKDLFTLENKLKQFQRNDLIYKQNDIIKKERIQDLIDKRMDLKQKEDQLYEQIRNIQKFSSSPSLIRSQQANNYYSTPQIPNKASNNINIFTNAGRTVSNIQNNQNNLFKNMDFNDFKKMRLLNNQYSLTELELAQINQNLQKFDSLVNKQPYVNNIMKLKSQNDITSEKHVVDYLKAQINDLDLQCTSLSRSSPYYIDKQRQIDHIKKIIFFIQNKNPFKPQADIGTGSNEQINGFHINWDFIKFIPSYVKRVKINYGIFKRESTFFTYRTTSDYYAHNQNYLDNTPDRQIAVINEQHVIQGMILQENVVLYLDLWIWDESDQNLIKYGWSLLDLFDIKGNFLPGKYRIPFYPKEMKAHSLFQNGLKYLSHNCFCYINVQTSKEHFNFNKQQFDYESEYYIPPLHLKPIREEIIYQPDSIQIYTSADDMPQVGIPKRDKTIKDKLDQKNDFIYNQPKAENQKKDGNNENSSNNNLQNSTLKLID
ncbi:hypothetical protein TTHERM_00165030 (macronuclear) [Tetrahymena thermophila SB210]|uniref:Uncharacterized protein n=1 Tax=Tetrahymena thermophila (strain SB210) TaxID=312017 RepID=Q22TM5_TETTS|nr:hypothetical protein TTHERM_00165030 [Tetrahymena thermophila SB210]EAR88413.2 hypothetical protein TTHERM_00165030 [Tetrahymena thermophila SB210]|eukprot:XP_001008658.2 hypothetical protein TTHERM_00165030 [Tetrahymena thermophila SB210]